MTTKRELIMAEVFSLLSNSSSPVTGVPVSRVYRNRAAALARAEGSAIVIEAVSDTPDPESFHWLEWNLTLRIAVIVRAAQPETTADAIVESLFSKLMADPSLNSKCLDLAAGTVSFEVVDADQPAAVISSDFVAIYRTEYNDLSNGD